MVVDGLFGLKRGDLRSLWETEQREGTATAGERTEATLLGLLGEREDRQGHCEVRSDMTKGKNIIFSSSLPPG